MSAQETQHWSNDHVYHQVPNSSISGSSDRMSPTSSGGGYSSEFPYSISSPMVSGMSGMSGPRVMSSRNPWWLHSPSFNNFNSLIMTNNVSNATFSPNTNYRNLGTTINPPNSSTDDQYIFDLRYIFTFIIFPTIILFTKFTDWLITTRIFNEYDDNIDGYSWSTLGMLIRYILGDNEVLFATILTVISCMIGFVEIIHFLVIIQYYPVYSQDFGFILHTNEQNGQENEDNYSITTRCHNCASLVYYLTLFTHFATITVLTIIYTVKNHDEHYPQYFHFIAPSAGAICIYMVPILLRSILRLCKAQYHCDCFYSGARFCQKCNLLKNQMDFGTMSIGGLELPQDQSLLGHTPQYQYY